MVHRRVVPIGVNRAGYQWKALVCDELYRDGHFVGQTAIQDWFCVPVLATDGLDLVHRKPAEGLFMTLVRDHVPSRTSVLKFVRRWGLLGEGCEARIPVTQGEIGEPDCPVLGLRAFARAWLKLKRVVDLWEWLRQDEFLTIRNNVQLVGSEIRVAAWGPISVDPLPSERAGAKEQLGPEPITFEDNPRSLAEAIRWFIADEVTEMLSSSIELRPTDDGFELIHGSGGSLFRALWYQLAEALEDRIEFRKCANPRCGGYIGSDRRSDAQYCRRPGCKKFMHRKRKETAAP